MEKNAYVIDFTQFTKDFFDSVINWFDNGEGRINGFQRIYIYDDEDYEYMKDDVNCRTVQTELRAKGFNEKDVILVDNTW